MQSWMDAWGDGSTPGDKLRRSASHLILANSYQGTPSAAAAAVQASKEMGAFVEGAQLQVGSRLYLSYWLVRFFKMELSLQSCYAIAYLQVKHAAGVLDCENTYCDMNNHLWSKELQPCCICLARERSYWHAGILVLELMADNTPWPCLASHAAA